MLGRRGPNVREKTNLEAIKQDLATGSGGALGFGPRRRAEAML
jgi:hypothetical protein